MEERAVCFGPESFGAHLSGRRQFLRLELLLRSPFGGEPPEGVEDPFLRPRGGSRLGSLFLARLSSNDGALDRLVTVKTLWDGAPAAGRRAPPEDPNPVQASLFQEQYRTLRLLREADSDPVVRLAPFDLKAGRAVELPRQLPLLFCRRRNLFFTPRCERCAGPLRDCQDDELLARSGLRPYSTSSVRYLHCPSCARSNAIETCFSASAEARQGSSVPVGDFRALLQSLGVLARSGRGGISEFPCADCPSAPTCYPAEGEGAAARVLTPFSFHDFYAFVLESRPWRLDECCDLLGGRDAAEVRTVAEEAGEGRAGGTLSRFFRSDPSGREALEVFLLKLGLCRELCQGVGAVWRRFKTPHLDLCPDAVWIGEGTSNLAVPGAWDLRVRVTAPNHPVPVENPVAGAAPLYHRPAAFNPVYAPRPDGAGGGADFRYDLFGLGMLLLRALLGSRRQSGELLSGVLARGADSCREAGEERRAEALLERLSPSMTDPGHLLWEGSAEARGAVPPELWRRSLLVGLGLLCRGESLEPDAVLERVVAELSALEAEARSALLLDQPRRGTELRRVLSELLEDEAWVASVEATAPAGAPPAPPERPLPTPPPPPEPLPEEDMEATIILGAGPPLQPRAAAAPGGRAAPGAPAATTPPACDDGDPEATIIAGRPLPAYQPPPAPGGAPPPGAVPPSNGEEFEETIILPSPVRKPKGAGER